MELFGSLLSSADIEDANSMARQLLKDVNLIVGAVPSLHVQF